MKAYTEDARDPGYKPPVRFAAYLSDQAHDPAAFTQMPTPLGVFPRIQPPPPDQGEHDYFPGEADRNLFEEIPERIIVEVSGGVAYSDDPRVIIIDHDNEREP